MDHSANFIREVIEIAKKLDVAKIDVLADEIFKIRENSGRLFIIGVGGSAANASHAVNDFRKLCGIDALAPPDNVAEITARTNDEGFETIFVGFLSVSKLSSRDCVLVLSVGGGDLDKGVSTNLCSAIDYAKSKGAKVMGIVGREGGHTHKFANQCLVIPLINPAAVTPHSEAFQAIVWHLMVSHPKLKTNATKW